MDDTRILVWLQLPINELSPSQARRAVTGLRHVFGDRYDDVLVAVSELVTNAVRHSGTSPDDRIDFRILDLGELARIEVADHGSGFATPPLEELDPDRDHGWGLAMVAAVADEWGIDRGEQTTVWMEIHIGAGGSDADEAGGGVTRSLVDAAVEALVTLDASGSVVDWNIAAGEMFHIARDAAVGHPIGELIVPPEGIGGPANQLRDSLDSVALGKPVEMTLRRGDDSFFPAQVRLTSTEIGRARLYHLSILDISAQKRSEEASEEMLSYFAYLADASEVLASSLDMDRTLRRLARLVVPLYADWCTINLVEDDGSIRRVAAEHADPARAAELARLLDTHPNEPDSESGVAYTIRTGEAQLFEEVDDALLAETANDPEYLEITKTLQIKSCVIAPLEAHGRVLGSISLVYTEQDKRYGDADLALVQDLGRRAGLALDNARLYEQRNHIAMTLQQSLLPPYLPEMPAFDLAARYEPAGSGNEVGGDFYDVFETGEDVWHLVVGDVEGKGPAAAALIGLARHTLRAVAIDHPSPAETLTLLNQVLVTGASDLCCTVALCRLAIAEDGAARITVARAGHPPPLLLRRVGAVEQLGNEGTLLGAIDSPTITETSTDLYPGDTVMMYTDGLAGARALEMPQLTGILSELAGKEPKSIADELTIAVERASEDGLEDDLAILVATRR